MHLYGALRDDAGVPLLPHNQAVRVAGVVEHGCCDEELPADELVRPLQAHALLRLAALTVAQAIARLSREGLTADPWRVIRVRGDPVWLLRACFACSLTAPAWRHLPSILFQMWAIWSCVDVTAVTGGLGPVLQSLFAPCQADSLRR